MRSLLEYVSKEKYYHNNNNNYYYIPPIPVASLSTSRAWTDKEIDRQETNKQTDGDRQIQKDRQIQRNRD